MGFLDKILPGGKPVKQPRDFADAETKAREGKASVIEITERTERLERRFFIDDVFPPIEGKREGPWTLRR